MTRRALVVFARLPEPGKVKTRMSPPLSSEQAADLYTQMLGDVLETSAEVCERAGADFFVSLTPADALLRFADDFADARSLVRARLVAQSEGELGQRMHRAFEEAAASGYDRIVLRGSDSPALAAEQLGEAFSVLEGVDVAIGPDVDGGYNWIAARRAHAGLLDHAMSTASVGADTLANAEQLGLRTKRLEESFDLDTVADLDRLRTPDAARRAPRTAAWLAARDAAS